MNSFKESKIKVVDFDNIEKVCGLGPDNDEKTLNNNNIKENSNQK